MNNSVFGKTMENVQKHKDIKLVTTDKKGSKLVPEPIYHTTKWFSESLITIEMRKIKVKMDKLVYLGLTILELSKLLMYEFRYHYVKLKYGEKTKLRHMDTHSFIINITVKAS